MNSFTIHCIFFYTFVSEHVKVLRHLENSIICLNIVSHITTIRYMMRSMR